MQPQANPDDAVVIALAILGFLGTSLTAILAFLAQREAKAAKVQATAAHETTIATGKAVDGRMGQMLQMQSDLSTTKGAALGVESERVRAESVVANGATPAPAANGNGGLG